MFALAIHDSSLCVTRQYKMSVDNPEVQSKTIVVDGVHRQVDYGLCRSHDTCYIIVSRNLRHGHLLVKYFSRGVSPWEWGELAKYELIINSNSVISNFIIFKFHSTSGP